ncbi:hypothetical protein B0A55_06694 [Friedmanniomyces simplex]|uniref:Zn(2)-C6 fungal-type domain-containing protein n=1 Tax=Friedmanniomyces simplex TaxID=329884 RepID=A0A4U0X7I4_9PEZI|nr:hypothetical protein B0A55_06694 [Friedmanniomyces simplex]
MTGTKTDLDNTLNSAKDSRRSSISGKPSGINNSRRRVPQLPSKYNPCAGCRDTEAYIRLTHDIHSLRALELAPMPLCNEAVAGCEGCSKAGLACKYDAGALNTSGRNEQEDLRYRLECRTREYQESVFLLRVFRHGSEQDAAALLARLRVGQDVETILESLRGKPEPQGTAPK